jgi:NAD(P)-dependent dehydrogenase (short-subunit alcohol dehydrogenase family)
MPGRQLREFEMKTILITGASRGIGLAAYKRLRSQNLYRFVIVGRKRPEIMPHDTEIEWFVDADFSDPELTQSAIEKIMKHSTFGNVDILINNAGLGFFANLEDISIDNWKMIMNVNLTSTYLFMRAFLPLMKVQNYGRIINISSDADHIGFAGAGAYCASKFGILGLSEAVRKELVGTNIAITTISPGRVDTFFNNKKPGDRPLSLKAEDIAEQIVQLLLLRENCNIEIIRLKSTLE